MSGAKRFGDRLDNRRDETESDEDVGNPSHRPFGKKIADYLKQFSLTPEALADETTVEKPVAAPPVEMNVVAEAANQPAVKRRRVGMRI